MNAGDDLAQVCIAKRVFTEDMKTRPIFFKKTKQKAEFTYTNDEEVDRHALIMSGGLWVAFYVQFYVREFPTDIQQNLDVYIKRGRMVLWLKHKSRSQMVCILFPALTGAVCVTLY